MKPISPDHSKREILKASKALRGDILQADQSSIEIFRIAHNWRASHILPMHLLRKELAAKCIGIEGCKITASRLKRMSSIRKKLRSGPHTFYQMQDIGGCRVILDDMDGIRQILNKYRDQPRHIFKSENDYLSEPKIGGYRSHHMVFKFSGDSQYQSFNNKPILIELQFRTKLQHAWATAVETVGMVEGQDMKGGKGNESWLRLFALMSSEFADIEKTKIVAGTPVDKQERRKEIRNLVKTLDAIKVLNGYKNAIYLADNYKNLSSPLYLIQYNVETKQVTVRGFSQQTSIEGYSKAENNNNSLNSVLVEVSKIADLRAAYPNYFLDVTIFNERLKDIVSPNRLKFPPNWLREWRGQ